MPSLLGTGPGVHYKHIMALKLAMNTRSGDTTRLESGIVQLAGHGPHG